MTLLCSCVCVRCFSSSRRAARQRQTRSGRTRQAANLRRAGKLQGRDFVVLSHTSSFSPFNVHTVSSFLCVLPSFSLLSLGVFDSTFRFQNDAQRVTYRLCVAAPASRFSPIYPPLTLSLYLSAIQYTSRGSFQFTPSSPTPEKIPPKSETPSSFPYRPVLSPSLQ